MKDFPELDLLPAESNWIFISASEKEPRHLLDIAWGVHALRARNVPEDRIFIYQDNPNFEPHLIPFKIEHRVFPLKTFFTAEEPPSPAGVSIYVFTGHGSLNGLVTTEGMILSPCGFFAKAKALQSNSRSFFVLTQCFAGIFQGLQARGSPELGVIASTQLNVSLSNQFPFPGGNTGLFDSTGQQVQPWSVNIFFYYFFLWVQCPVDIDGDGKNSLLDAYKYSGSMTNNLLAESRLLQSVDPSGRFEVERKKLREHTASGGKLLSTLELESSIETLKSLTAGLHQHTEPWTLYADLLRITSFK